MATIRTFEELNIVARPRYLLRPLIELGNIGMVYGPSGLGKTFVILDLAMSIASGRPWAGMATKELPIAYVSAEGSDALGRRVRAWGLEAIKACETDEERQHVLDALQRNFIVVPHAIQMANDLAREDLVASLRNVFPPDRRLGLVIIDTVARCSVDLEENSNSDMGRFVEACAALKGALRAPQDEEDDSGEPAILLVHHTGKAVLGADGEPVERGASSLKGALEYSIALDAGPPLRLLVQKIKDGAAPMPMLVEWSEPVLVGYDMETSEDITSIVARVSPPGSALAPAEMKMQRKKADEAQLDRKIMDEMIRNPQLTVREIALNLDISKTVIGRRIKRLTDEGQVTRRDRCYYASSDLFVPAPIMLGDMLRDSR